MFFKEPVACSALKIKMSVINAQKYLQALRMTYCDNVTYYKLPSPKIHPLYYFYCLIPDNLLVTGRLSIAIITIKT